MNIITRFIDSSHLSEAKLNKKIAELEADGFSVHQYVWQANGHLPSGRNVILAVEMTKEEAGESEAK